MYVKTLDSGDNSYFGDEGSPDFVDLVFGGDGDDYIEGGVDDDTLYGQNGDDTLHGGFNNDFLSGGAGADWLYGDTGDDTVFGGSGGDRLYGGRGADYLSGEDGDDTFYVDSADGVFFDTYNGGAGFDTLMASSTIYADALYSIEKIDVGGLSATELQFSAADTVADLTGVDTTALVTIRMGAGADSLIDNDSGHLLYGDDGDDFLQARGGDDGLLGGAGNDDLDGGDGDDTFRFVGADAGFDRIAGGVGFDTLTAGDGVGGAGNDTVIGLSTVDSIELITSGGYSNVTIAGDANGNDLDFSETILVDIVSISGGDGSDFIIGGALSDDVINGDAGNDILAGAGGDDLLDGGAGDDTAFFLGNEADYSVVTVGGVTTVTDLRAPAPGLDLDGQDTLTNIEFLQFADNRATIGMPSNVAPSDPVDTNAAANAISEDTINGAVVGGLALSSNDTAGDSRVYELVDDAGGRFVINAATGLVTVANASLIDYETATSHDIQVRVFDGLAYSATVTFTINVTDFLENVTYTGTSGADTKAADTNARWTMTGLEGADVLTGAGKDDVLIGGAGDDTLNGGAGADLFLFDGAGEGFDAIVGGADTDIIRAESDGTVIGLRSLSGVEMISAGGHANVSIAGSAGGDTLDLSAVTLVDITAPIDLGAGADTFTGTSGADVVIGGAGGDTLNGGAGADIFLANTFTAEGDAYNGGADIDQVLATADNVVIGLRSSGISGVELVSAGGFANVVIAGATSGDILNFTGVALDGIAEIQGGAGNDTITGSAGADVIDGGNDNDTVRGGAGNDTIIGGRASGNSGNDLLYGEDGDDTFLFFVNPQVDSYYGGAGWDKIQAGQANVQLYIGLGPTVSATLQVEEISAGGFTGVSIALQDRYTGSSWLGQTLDFSAVKLTGIAYLAGTLGADTITTGADDDTVVGGDSADVIQTGGGADYLRGDAGNDTLRGGLGNDTLIGGVGDDSSFGDDGDDVFSFTGTGLGWDGVTGGAGDDVITALANGTVIGLRSFSEVETITAGGFTGVSIQGSANADLLDFSSVSVVGISAFSAGGGADVLIGTAAADTISGDGGDDTLSGGDGDDVFQFTGAAGGADAINGGNGSDTVTALAANTIIGLSSFTNVELITSGGFAGVTVAGSLNGDVLDFSTITLSGIGKIDGGAGNDTITGTAAADVLLGSGGDDTLLGGEGNDTFQFTGAVNGADAINGGDGTDTLVALAASTVIGLASFSNIEAISSGGFAGVSIAGSTNADSLDFSAVTLTGITKIDGGAGHDVITGTAAADVILGSGGDDVLNGGDGNDSFQYTGAANGFDTVTGGNGTDTLKALAASTVIGLTSFTGFEAIDATGFAGVSVVLGGGDDLIDLTVVTATNLAAISGGAGTDTFVGASANDTFNGDDGDDTFFASAGADAYAGGLGADTLKATANNQFISLRSIVGVETITANGFTGVTIAGTTAADTLDLSSTTLVGIGKIDGGAGNDAITGTAGADVLDGGANDDTLSGGDGDDLITYGVSGGIDAVNGGNGADVLQATAANLTIAVSSLTNVETVTANGFANVILGGGANADLIDLSSTTLIGIGRIDGAAGADTILGSAAADIIMGGLGDDMLSGGDGDDVFQFTGATSGADAINGGNGGDTVTALAANTIIGLSSFTNVELITSGGFAGVTVAGSLNGDVLDFSTTTLSGIGKIDGGAGNDVITGTAAADILLGSGGDDVLNGGDGNDSFQYTGAANGFDAINGGDGTDTLVALAASTVIGLASFSNIEAISSGGFAGVSIAGSTNADSLDFSAMTLTGITKIDGGAGADAITGTAAADVILGSGGDDVLNGGDGNDSFQYTGAANGFDTVTGGNGTDTLKALAASTVIGLASFTGFEAIDATGFAGVSVVLGGGDDLIDLTVVTATNLAAISGGAGADTFVGASANDTFNGDDGDDTFFASAGADAYAGGLGADTLKATANGQVISLRSIVGVETITANGFTGVTIAGTTAAETFNFAGLSVSGIDSIDGGGGNDVITGASGADVIIGGLGDDTLAGGDGDDTFRFGGTGLGVDAVNGGLGYDTLVATANGTVIGVGALTGVEAISANGFTGVSLVGSTVADLWDFSTVAVSGIGLIDGGSGNDNIIGTADADVLQGSAGDDTLNGGAGDDTFLYTAAANGLDTVTGGFGHDVLKATAAGAVIGLAAFSGLEAITANGFANVSIGGTSIADVVDFSAVTLTGIVKIDGGAGNDTITGSAGDDVIYGGFGLDTIYAGGGNDTIGVVAIEAGQNADYFVDGGSGVDTVVAVQTGGIYMLGFTGIEAFSNNGFANVHITGWTNGSETFDFSNATLTGISYITGLGGNDTIIGSAGADKIMLSLGQDVLTGGGGADIFFMEVATDSTVGVAHDVITDFLVGTDHIDLTTLDARTNVAGNQAFTFVGGAAFSNVSGELRADYTDPLHTMIYGDVNGDGVADFAIELAGSVSLSSTDFFL